MKIKIVSILSEQSGRMTALGLMVTLSVTMVLSGVLLSYDANAGALTSVSDTLTESAPSSKSDHTIVFTTQAQIPTGGSFSIDFQGANAVFATASVDYTDIDVLAPGHLTLVACGTQTTSDWGVCVSGSMITFQAGSTALINTGEVTVRIGLNATSGATGDQQLTNPSATAGTQITIRTYNASDVLLDEGLTFVAIVNGVTLHAYVAPSFTFEIEGMTNAAADQIETYTVASDSTATYVGFGTLTAGTPITMGSSLSVTTNAQNGFKVTVHQNHNMMTSSSADIDSFQDGTPTTGAVWAAPAGTLGSEATYGHLGLYTEDASNTAFSGTASVSTASDGHWFGLTGSTPFEVWDWSSSADGSTQDIGHIDVGYRVQVSALQEYGHYYNRLTYIATPTF